MIWTILLLRQVRELRTRTATTEAAEALHGLGTDVVVARMPFADGGSLDVAATSRDRRSAPPRGRCAEHSA